MAAPQNYANHAYRPALTGGAALAAIAALTFVMAEAVRRPGPLVFGVLFLTIAVMFLIAISRAYTLRLQDRIIALEMRMRLARLGREADYGRLSRRQLIALRFASDAELPSLIQRAIGENLTSRQIKEAIRDWQPDHHRT